MGQRSCVVLFGGVNQGNGMSGRGARARKHANLFWMSAQPGARLRFCPSDTCRRGPRHERTLGELPFRGRVCMMVQNVGALARWLFRLACPAVL